MKIHYVAILALVISGNIFCQRAKSSTSRTRTSTSQKKSKYSVPTQSRWEAAKAKASDFGRGIQVKVVQPTQKLYQEKIKPAAQTAKTSVYTAGAKAAEKVGLHGVATKLEQKAAGTAPTISAQATHVGKAGKAGAKAEMEKARKAGESKPEQYVAGGIGYVKGAAGAAGKTPAGEWARERVARVRRAMDDF